MSFIEDYNNLTLKDLNDFITTGQEEHIHLDFKLVNDAKMSSSDDKRNFACALSGFANSSGGLIVWGVDARKNSEQIDCAVGLKPIDKVALLVSRLNSLTGEAVEPIVELVQHRAIISSGNQGFVLSLVPESEVGPHMAKLGENRYYKRSGDSFYKMEHYDIADMFGSRRKPKLVVFYKVVGKGDRAEIHLGIENKGRATAKAPFLSFENEGNLQRSVYGLNGNGHEGLKCLQAATSGLQWAYGGGMDFALHPAMKHLVASLTLGIPARNIPQEDLVISYKLACEDQPLESGELIVPLNEFT